MINRSIAYYSDASGEQARLVFIQRLNTTTSLDYDAMRQDRDYWKARALRAEDKTLWAR